LLLHNDSEHEVRDRNGDEGSLIIRPRAYTLKSGKFEGGLSSRMYLNYVHYHRKRQDDSEETGIFPSLLKLLLVHFVTTDTPKTLRALETSLNQAVRALLKETGKDEPEQTSRSESRWIRGEPPSREDLENLFRRVINAAR
jgi:hypothetical protein